MFVIRNEGLGELQTSTELLTAPYRRSKGRTLFTEFYYSEEEVHLRVLLKFEDVMPTWAVPLLASPQKPRRSHAHTPGRQLLAREA